MEKIIDICPDCNSSMKYLGDYNGKEIFVCKNKYCENQGKYFHVKNSKMIKGLPKTSERYYELALRKNN